MRDAREFQFEAEDEAELPKADLPVLFPLFGVVAAVVCLNTAKNSHACALTRKCTQTQVLAGRPTDAK